MSRCDTSARVNLAFLLRLCAFALGFLHAKSPRRKEQTEEWRWEWGTTRAPRVVFGALAEHSGVRNHPRARVIGEGADDCTRGGCGPPSQRLFPST